jgi:hypothetical protein
VEHRKGSEERNKKGIRERERKGETIGDMAKG